MKETTIDNIELGTFSAKDIALAGTFAYLLGNRWSGGITLRFISSSIAGYNSIGIATDLGLNYLDEERGWSISAVAKNLGGQVKAYQDTYEKIPFDLQVGISKHLNSTSWMNGTDNIIYSMQLLINCLYTQVIISDARRR